MAEQLTVTHERVDDIPLLIGVMRRMGLPQVLDRHLGNHGHHQGLSNGWLATLWLGYILSQGDHRKSTVQDWANRRQQMLERLVGSPLRSIELSDDRLEIVLRRLSKAGVWDALEEDLWHSTVLAYEMPLTRVRVDSTTVSGYHTVREDGIMRYGQSKDHRPDLPQLKLMAAAAEPVGHLMACTAHAGNKADDGLYLPLIGRVRQMVGHAGLLYVGDSKMSALDTRATLIAHGDHYLVPLAATGQTRDQQAEWIERAVEGDQASELYWQGEQCLGAGYAFERAQEALIDGETIRWTERVLVIRSPLLARERARYLEERLTHAMSEVQALTQRYKKRCRQYTTEELIQAAVNRVLERHEVSGLLRAEWRRDDATTSSRGVKGRYVITSVERDEAAIGRHKNHLGWRIYGTDVPVTGLSTDEAIAAYRGGWCLERDFHLLKDRPLGISPLYVHREDQIAGLTYLLTLAVRLQTLIETQVRAHLARGLSALSGLYAGQPTRTTTQPTAVRLLAAFARAEITLTRIQTGTSCVWHLTPLSVLLDNVLTCLGLPSSLYTSLAADTS